MHVVSVSWTDHLSFGDGDGRLATPDAVQRRLAIWRAQLGARALHWRAARRRIAGRFHAARGYRHPSQTAAAAIGWDDFDVVPRLAEEAGLEPWLYVSVFDEGWPLPSPATRAVSYHNDMHGQHVSWQSELTRLHPDWVVVDRRGRRQWGVLSLAYPEARQALIARWLSLMSGTRFAGLFLCCRSQSRPAEHADQFGYNAPVRSEFLARHGVDIARQPFDVRAWRDLTGEYLTRLLEELHEELARAGRRLAIGVARGGVIGPPLGNATLHWPDWLRRGLLDHLVVDQDSTRCPSMWHRLWPMHRGVGYVQDYADGNDLPPLVEHLRSEYGPLFAGTQVRLYVARQWHPRSDVEERTLTGIEGVSGLVFSSFRHDNAGAIARGDWRAGRLESARSSTP